MIDVHVCTRDGDRADWLQAALASLQGQPVTVHTFDGTGRSTATNRRHGYGLGQAPYVACLDPDDLALPGGFQAITEALQASPGRGLYFTREEWIDANGRVLGWGDSHLTPPTLDRIITIPSCSHHLAVMPRELVHRALEALDPEFDHPATVCWWIRAWCAVAAGFHHLPVTGARWRRYPEQSHRRPDPPIERVREALAAL